MNRCRALLSLAILTGALAHPAAALELLAPAPKSTLQQGKVIVIGLTPGADRGSAEWEGKRTGFRVRDGRFHVTLELGPGTHTVRFAAGDANLTADWNVEPDSPAGAYVYHRKVGDGECTACHEPRDPPEPGTDVSGICYECHTTYALRRHTHGPTATGLCTLCHDPHGSTRPTFLRMDPGELCTYCHNQPVTQRHRERAADKPCLGCHDPHGTNRVYQLKSR